jgi:hypothetical protein
VGTPHRADYLPFVIFAPLLGVFAFAYDGIYRRDMGPRRVLMLFAVIFLAAWFALGRSAMPDCGARWWYPRGARRLGAAVSGAVEEVVQFVARMSAAHPGRVRVVVLDAALIRPHASGLATSPANPCRNRRSISADDLGQRSRPVQQVEARSFLMSSTS